MTLAAAAMLMLAMEQGPAAPPVPPPPPPPTPNRVSIAPPAVYPPPVRPVPSPPAPPAPPPKKARARPLAPLGSLIGKGDYPKSAFRANEQGTVGFRLGIGSEGEVESCVVTLSSGSAALDMATCRIMRLRATFAPARDHLDRPTSDRIAGRIAWRINQRFDQPFEPMMMIDEMRSDADGILTCWSARNGEPLAVKPCKPPPNGSNLSNLARAQRMPLALSIVAKLTPEGAAPLADDVARGDLYSTADARLTIARDGSILECRVLRNHWVGGGNRGTPPSPCLDWYPKMRLYAPAPQGASARFVDVTVRAYAKHSIRRAGQ